MRSTANVLKKSADLRTSTRQTCGTPPESDTPVHFQTPQVCRVEGVRSAELKMPQRKATRLILDHLRPFLVLVH